ncbi:MAG: hypothetical protein AAGG45_00515 [Pseudomonadota bacterium]
MSLKAFNRKGVMRRVRSALSARKTARAWLKIKMSKQGVPSLTCAGHIQVDFSFPTIFAGLPKTMSVRIAGGGMISRPKESTFPPHHSKPQA